jgi:hypothetical protein
MFNPARRRKLPSGFFCAMTRYRMNLGRRTGHWGRIHGKRPRFDHERCHGAGTLRDAHHFVFVEPKLAWGGSLSERRPLS